MPIIRTSKADSPLPGPEVLDRLDKSAEEVIVDSRRYEPKPRHFQRASRSAVRSQPPLAKLALSSTNLALSPDCFTRSGVGPRLCAACAAVGRTTGNPSHETTFPAQRNDFLRRYCRTGASADRSSDHFSKCGLAASQPEAVATALIAWAFSRA